MLLIRGGPLWLVDKPTVSPIMQELATLFGRLRRKRHCVSHLPFALGGRHWGKSLTKTNRVHHEVIVTLLLEIDRFMNTIKVRGDGETPLF